MKTRYVAEYAVKKITDPEPGTYQSVIRDTLNDAVTHACALNAHDYECYRVRREVWRGGQWVEVESYNDIHSVEDL
ncbi:MAG: hypothetical protein AAF434_17395 [Pseudomonadota bacterium]